jgi:rhamnulokinase
LKPTQDFLALDVGATSGRAVIGKFDGHLLQLQEVHRFRNGPVKKEDGLYWNFPALLKEVDTALQRASAESQHIVSLGCDAWGLDHGFLDKAGLLLEWPYCYQDSRTGGIQSEMESRISRRELFSRTAAPHLSISTLCQLLATRQNRPDLLHRADCMLFIPDLIHHYLTGQKVTELSMASTSQLVSWADHHWDMDIIDRFDLPRSLFPEIKSASEKIGSLKKEVIRRLQIPEWDIHLPACHDTASAVVAAPLGSPADAVLSSGTWSMLGILVDQPIGSEEAAAAGYGSYKIPGSGWAFMGGIMGLWFLERFRREERLAVPEVLIEGAEKAPSLASLFDPQNTFFAQAPSLRSALIRWYQATRQAVPETKEAFIRSILESLALFYRESLERISRFAARKINRLVIVGGGSQNRLLNQLTANACGIPVVTAVAEATAAGNILMQMAGCGLLSSPDEIRSLGMRSWPCTVYEPQEQSMWQEARQRFAGIQSETIGEKAYERV